MQHPFLFVGHGEGGASKVRYLVVSRGRSLEGVMERVAPWSPELDGPTMTLRAPRSSLAAVERALQALHADVPLLLVSCTKAKKLSKWHRESVGRAPELLSGVVVLARALGKPYVKQHTQLSRVLAEALLSVSHASSKAARPILNDAAFEVLPQALGFDFDVDVALREVLATFGKVSLTDVEMPARFQKALAATTRKHHRRLHAGRARVAARAACSWKDLRSIQAALREEPVPFASLRNAFLDTEPKHMETFLALTPEERVVLCRESGLFATLISNVATQRLYEGNYALALTLYDAAVEGPLDSGAAANPLFAVQDDNNHLGVDARRARRYLERCLPHGPENPAVFFNASFVWAELGEPEQVIASLQAAKKHGYAVKNHRNERLYQPLRARADFQAIMK